VSEKQLERIELFKKAVLETLKEVDGATIDCDQLPELENLVEEKLRARTRGLCRKAYAVAEWDDWSIYMEIYCDELSTTMWIPVKVAVSTKEINNINIDTDT
jgi:hypothetical protein